MVFTYLFIILSLPFLLPTTFPLLSLLFVSHVFCLISPISYCQLFTPFCFLSLFYLCTIPRLLSFFLSLSLSLSVLSLAPSPAAAPLYYCRTILFHTPGASYPLTYTWAMQVLRSQSPLPFQYLLALQSDHFIPPLKDTRPKM